jgi:hypothetical protein
VTESPTFMNIDDQFTAPRKWLQASALDGKVLVR